MVKMLYIEIVDFQSEWFDVDAPLLPNGQSIKRKCAWAADIIQVELGKSNECINAIKSSQKHSPYARSKEKLIAAHVIHYGGVLIHIRWHFDSEYGSPEADIFVVFGCDESTCKFSHAPLSLSVCRSFVCSFVVRFFVTLLLSLLTQALSRIKRIRWCMLHKYVHQKYTYAQLDH